LDSLSAYLAYRKWGVIVEPEGMDVDRVWWSELTAGIRLEIPFSIFE
jgi:hypothetical protein